MKQLLEQVRNDWRLLKNKLEIDIIEKYACNSRFFTMTVMGIKEDTNIIIHNIVIYSIYPKII